MNVSPKYVVVTLVITIATMSIIIATLVVHAQTETKTFSGRATFQAGDAGGSIENNMLLTQKVINLQNTGSHPDTFRTTLPVNPDTRCGLRGPNDSYPPNTLPNTLPTTLDMPLAVSETTYISVVCVTKELPAGPFTWSYKTVSAGSLDAGVEKVLAEVQDTVNVTATTPCSDSDGGINSGFKGIATGTYAGAVSSYIAIYGQEPNPNTPKTTTDKFSTYIDHCSWDPTQLNEGYCDASGRLQAIGIKCSNGCQDGICVLPPSPPPPPPPPPPSTSPASVSGQSTISAPSGSPSPSDDSGSPSPTPSVPAKTPDVQHPSASQTANGKILPNTTTGDQMRDAQEKPKKVSAEIKKELQTLKNQKKQIHKKITHTNKKAASLEKKIDGKLRFLDRVKKPEVQKRVETQIDRWEAQITSLEEQKQKLEDILEDIEKSFDQLRATSN